MIQNILTFCVKNDLTFVDGSLPSGKLVANDINRNSIYLITPFDNAIVKANFQTNLQSDKPTSVLGFLVDGNIEVKEIVSENATYYPLVKDWHIYEFKVPSKTLQFISRNRTGRIGINFSIEQRLIPAIKSTYGTYGGEIINGTGINTPQGEVYYYINKTIGFNYYGIDFDLNDIVVDDADNMDAYKISAYSNRGSTPTTMFSVDPSVLNDNFETVEPSLTAQIVSQVNENVNDIVLILQAIGVSDATLVSFGNRISVAEQDIDKIEDGTTVVGKALKDDLGNTIKSTYANKLDLVYSSINNRIAITLKSYDGTPIDADLIDLPKATTSADGLLSKEDKVKINNIASDIASMGATKQSLSEKNQINGYAGLDVNAKIPSILLPDSVLGQLEYKGTFTPTAYPSSPEKGWFYISIGNGTISGVDYKVGDWAVFNGSTWDKVDNTDAVMSVNGKIGVVILNGTDIKVGNGDTWTIEQRIVNIYAELNNRYTKAQTYSQNEIEQRLTDLLGMANLQDILIGSYTNGQTVLASDLSPYNFVIVLGKDGNDTYTGTFKPSEIVSGNVISLSSTVYLTRDATSFTITTPTSIKMWGIKLDGITADEIGYGVKTVEDALNEIFEPEYTTATHVKLTNEITATNNVEIIDDTGTVIEVEGNEPTNLVVNGENEITFTDYQNRPYNEVSIIEGNKYYLSIEQKLVATVYSDAYGGIRFLNNDYIIPAVQTILKDQQYHTFSGIFTSVNTFTGRLNAYSSGSEPRTLYLKNAFLYNITDMIRKGIKADDGRLLSSLTDGELKVQMDTWVANGFSTVVEKLISKSDNLFDGTFTTLTSLESENLVSNGDFLIAQASPNQNEPLGFTYVNSTDIMLTDGVAKFTATERFGRLTQSITGLSLSDKYYIFGRVKSDSNLTVLTLYTGDNGSSHSGSNTFELLSRVTSPTDTTVPLVVIDRRFDDWTPIEVDYMGAINITDLVSRGILPGGLTDAQYKELLDNKMFDNVPLRETNYVSVEPNKAYKLIKASGNVVTHKVIEYTTDNQVVKVTHVVYTNNKYTFTTNALTSKIKLVSDLLERPINLVINGDFSDGDNGWSYYNTKATIMDGRAYFYRPEGTGVVSLQQTNRMIVGNSYYYSFELENVIKGNGIYGLLNNGGNPFYLAQFNTFPLGKYNVSGIITPIIIGPLYFNAAEGSKYYIDNVAIYDITEMKNSGVKNDSGTLFSRLTNDEIKDQMDIWIKTGFPDHVIAAIYPNGVDNAIAFKYNDADDIFRPQSIDELPLNLTLRSGEKWKDGYVIKQNGNAQYYPLQTKFSAWNYGQLEAIYTSGIPADFKIQYAQNTGAQVQTTNHFLVEAREQLDYVTEGYDKLIDKLGDDVLGNGFDSFAGITSPTYEYYGLQGIKEGSELAIEGYGQSIQNLLSKATTIQATQTVRGVTVAYDSETGIFTANGTSTAGAAFNIVLATGIDFGLPTGTAMQLMRYYDSGTINLNGSYVGYTITGVSTSNRINENSESLYDPYINGSGNLTANHATNKQQVIFQVWAPGIVFTDFKFKIGIYEGLQLRPFILPTGTPAKSNVTIYNRTVNVLNVTSSNIPVTAGVTITYDDYNQEFLLSGTATGTASVSLNATFAVKSGDRLSIKRLYQSGDVTGVGGVLPRIKLDNASNTTIVYNDIYKMTAPEGQIPTPDISFNTGTAPADATLTLKLGITSGQVFDNYRFRLMVHNKSNDIGYVNYRKETVGTMMVGANEKAVIKFKSIPFGILEFVANNDSLNLLYGDSITDLRYTILEYNAGIGSPNRKISGLDERISSIDNVFKDKVIAVWGDSRESNNPTSDPNGVGDQKDTSWPALLAKKLGAKVLNFGLSGGAWAQNTVQQDEAAAIVNRVQTEDPTASADIIIISSMNDFKLATPLGLPTSRTITDYYGSLRLTFERLATKYPGKKIVVVLPQKRYDENVKYGSGASYYAYRKAQMDVCKEYGISTVDLYNNFPNSKLGSAPTAYATYMLNDTHFSAAGNDFVAELVARHLIGNGNSGSVDSLPPLPSTDGTYTLKVVITGGIPVFSWVA